MFPHSAYRRGVRWSFAGSMAVAFFQFLQMSLFARLAGPAAAGDFALAATCIGFLLPLAEAGLGQALVQTKDIQPGQVAALAWVNFGLGVLVFGLLWLFGPFVVAWYERPDLSDMLLFMGTSLFLSPFAALQTGLLQRDMQFDRIVKVEIISWLFTLPLVVVLAWRGWGAWAMAAGFVGRNALVLLGNLCAGKGLYVLQWHRPASLATVRPLLRFGLFDLGARWSDFGSNYLDKLIVGKWLGTTALGYYNLAFTFLMLPTARLGYVLTRASFPVFAGIKEDAVQLQAFFGQLMRQLILVLFPVYMGMALFSREIVLLFFGEAWLPAAPLFVAFGLAGLVRSLSAAFPLLLNGLGKPQWALVWSVVWTLVLNSVLILFIWIQPSALSATWSRTAAKFLFETGLLWLLAGWCGLHFGPVIRFATRTVFHLAPVAGLVLLIDWIPGNIWVVFGLKIFVFVVVMAWFGFKSPLRVEVAGVFKNFKRGE